MLKETTAVAQLVEALRYKPEGRGFDSRFHYVPGVYSASGRNEFQEHFLGRGVSSAGAQG
jgi:hypothetical protein